MPTIEAKTLPNMQDAVNLYAVLTSALRKQNLLFP
jgi:hypothetical protein